jgi:hypothetical protein
MRWIQWRLQVAVTARQVTWQRDFDAALADARRASKHVLVDFSAAPL